MPKGKPHKPMRRTMPANTSERRRNRRDRRDDPDADLTPAQWDFLNAFLGPARGNAVEAARIAGLGTSYKQWSNNSSYLLTIPKVQKRLKEQLELQGLNAAMTMHLVARSTQASMADFFAYNEDGSVVLDELGRPRIDLERARQLGKLDLIERMRVDQYGVTIDLPKRTEALALLAKFHGLLADRLQVEVKGDEDIVRAEVLAKLREAALGMDEADRRILAGLPSPGAPNNKVEQGAESPDGGGVDGGAHAHAGPRQGGRGPATQGGGQGKVIEV